MRVIALRTLREFWEKHADAEGPLRAWHEEARTASWATPADITARFSTASVFENGRACFNFGGGKYRLVVHVRYDKALVFVRFIGTHKQYDGIDANRI